MCCCLQQKLEYSFASNSGILGGGSALEIRRTCVSSQRELWEANRARLMLNRELTGSKRSTKEGSKISRKIHGVTQTYSWHLRETALSLSWISDLPVETSVHFLILQCIRVADSEKFAGHQGTLHGRIPLCWSVFTGERWPGTNSACHFAKKLVQVLWVLDRAPAKKPSGLFESPYRRCFCRTHHLTPPTPTRKSGRAASMLVQHQTKCFSAAKAVGKRTSPKVTGWPAKTSRRGFVGRQTTVLGERCVFFFSVVCVCSVHGIDWRVRKHDTPRSFCLHFRTISRQCVWLGCQRSGGIDGNVTVRLQGGHGQTSTWVAFKKKKIKKKHREWACFWKERPRKGCMVSHFAFWQSAVWFSVSFHYHYLSMNSFERWSSRNGQPPQPYPDFSSWRDPSFAWPVHFLMFTEGVMGHSRPLCFAGWQSLYPGLHFCLLEPSLMRFIPELWNRKNVLNCSFRLQLGRGCLMILMSGKRECKADLTIARSCLSTTVASTSFWAFSHLPGNCSTEGPMWVM